MPLPLLSCTSLLSSRSADGEDCLSLLEKIPRGNLAISKTYLEPELFFFLSTMLGPQTCFLFVCELVSILLSDSKMRDSPPAKLKPVKDYLKEKKKKRTFNLTTTSSRSRAWHKGRNTCEDKSSS